MIQNEKAAFFAQYAHNTDNAVLEIIWQAKQTRATRLDLGNCGLTELPDALFELTWLEELILSDVSEIRKFRNLSALKNLLNRFIFSFICQLAIVCSWAQQPPQEGIPSPKVVAIPNNKDNKVFKEPEMVFVEGGTFLMGCSTSQQGADCYDWEKPVHKVSVSSFSIGKYEITQKQWRDVMDSDPPDLSHKRCDECPVESVSWDDIQLFLQKTNEKTKKKYRLPTENEWEFAALGGNKSKKYIYSGSDTIDNVAWYSENSTLKSHPVGQLKSNELGIFDMIGNVSEWCSDWYSIYEGGRVSNRDIVEKETCRVYRGGSYHKPSYFCRVSYRTCFLPSFGTHDLGFRVVLTHPL